MEIFLIPLIIFLQNNNFIRKNAAYLLPIKWLKKVQGIIIKVPNIVVHKLKHLKHSAGYDLFLYRKKTYSYNFNDAP